MKQNVGKIDRIIRAIVGLGLLSLGFLLDGNARYIAVLGVPLLVSAMVGVCLLYCPLRINTCCCQKNEGSGEDTGETKSCCSGQKSCGTDKETVA